MYRDRVELVITVSLVSIVLIQITQRQTATYDPSCPLIGGHTGKLP